MKVFYFLTLINLGCTLFQLAWNSKVGNVLVSHNKSLQNILDILKITGQEKISE